MQLTKEQLIDQAREEVAFWRERDELIPSQQTAIRLRLAEIAMAVFMTPEQEPVADVVAWSSPSEERTCDIRWRRHDVKPGPLYTAPPVLVVPDGYALVPVEPTESMIIAGFEAELREEFRDPDAWEAYEAMSGCEQAALRAKWCWAEMVKAAPQQEDPQIKK
ncbi:hypothetical protein A8O28_12425 [Enterobacteriaceae bacterium CCUG 67584]|nr:hypothetical protein [Enterobacteriaceae bacterium CCUG 67584]